MSDSRTTPRWTAVLALAPFAIGCEGPGGTAGPGLHAAMRDSAGIMIVENTQPAPDSRLPWEIGAQASLSIGSVASGGADELFQVRDATQLEDGRIVIVNLGSNELKVFGPDGSHAGTWGRQGEGPGEFTRHGPTAVVLWPGDSVAAVDAPYSPRLPLFDLEGNHGRDIAFDVSRGGILGVLPDGKIVSSGSEVFNRMTVFETRDLVRLETEWSVLDADGTLHASLGRFLYGEAYFSELWGGDMHHPFQRRATGAVWGNLVAVGVPDTYEIRAFAADGTLVRIVRREWDPRTPTEADYPMPAPPIDSYPAFEQVLSDRAGYLWVKEYRVPGEGEGAPVWTVFDPEGRVQGLVETPSGLDVFEIGEDSVLGLAKDELGVEYVQRWALDRGVG